MIPGRARYSARSSVSATTALTATITCGSSSHRDGVNLSRYSASAASVFCAEKWCANENGSPSMPASWAENPLDPSSQICGRSPARGVAGSSRGSPDSMPITSISSFGKCSADRPSMVRRSASAVR